MLTAIADTKDLLQYAMHHNCLVIDANNKSDVHKYDVPIEELSSTFFLFAETLYRLLPTLQQAKTYCETYKLSSICVTSFDKVFTYGNDKEDYNLFVQIWLELIALGESYTVYVVVDSDRQHDIAQDLGVRMGHTISSQRRVSQTTLRELKAYGDALPTKDKLLYHKMLKQPLKHFGSITHASSKDTLSFMLLSIMLEQQKEIERLREHR